MQQAKALLTTRHEDETAYAGELLGLIINRPLTVALDGELGTGKTVFVRGAAKGLGVKRETVASPTFVLLKIYSGRLNVYHFDFYRLSSEDDFLELGFEEYLPGDGAAFVEWAGRLPELLPPEHLQVVLEVFEDHQGQGRRIWFLPHGKAARQVVDQLFKALAWKTDGSLYQQKPRDILLK